MRRKLEKSGKLAIVFTVLAFVLWNCKEDPNSTGMELLPGSDLNTVGQSIEKESIGAFTQHDLRLRTDEPNFNLFGTFNDPVFGKTTADLAVHVRLASYPNFDETIQVDSLVLYLLYKEVYGDTTTMQSLKVYELVEDVFLDTTDASGTGDYPYYQDVDLKALASATPIGELDYYPVFRLDSTETDTLIQELAIKLDDSVAEKLYQADSLDMINNDAFVNFFKGLYVESQDVSSGGAMLSLYTLATGSNLTMHYTKVTDTLVTDSLRFVYRINANSARVSSFRHDYSTTVFADQLVEQPESPDSLIYLQTMGGLRAKIDIPTLDNWRDSVLGDDRIIINKAALVFQVDTVASDYRQYRIPAGLILTGIDIIEEKEKEYLPADFSLSSSLYGGRYNATNATYTFNITHHLQNLIDGEVENYGFYLAPSFRNERARRVVLKGASSHAGIRLEVTYTKLN
ncbi:DUF4270 domain-containing protein [Sunxiuqinia dokdonensis]|uniref:DUF4270 domain-containing protein n=1 Tax=Sunxiuqinia dokdonensis TaxID=1409788 RepID=A0A0L8V4L6_9BACT|nr:DUF4270 domain-containing protein [Sunxiuqinia dokdonensis]KOH43298.1 hypothetical protein NC99_38580 [Sunxiuqinia dokdonensis]